MPVPSHRIAAAADSFGPIARFYGASRYAERRFAEGVADFTFGNPHEMPLPGIVDAIRHHAVPLDKNWFAYKNSEEKPQAFIAEHLGRELGPPFAPEDIAITTGAFGAIMVAMHLVLDAGDEMIFSEPGWFCYEPMARAADVVPVKVALKGPRFDLDLEAIDAAITERTGLVVVNSPHNPTGRIYSEATLRELADLLERASARTGRRIFLLSDEPYRRLRFDGREFTSPASIYPWTLISYSYGKVLLAPGQRLGYLALSPLMPSASRHELADALFSAQMALGWCFPTAVMQYAIPDLETLSIDVSALTHRRDTLMQTLTAAGYAMLPPEGTFYLWGKWPAGDPERHWNALADRDVFVLPGSVMNSPDHFRISLTASDDMIARALPAFADIAG